MKDSDHRSEFGKLPKAFKFMSEQCSGVFGSDGQAVSSTIQIDTLSQCIYSLKMKSPSTFIIRLGRPNPLHAHGDSETQRDDILYFETASGSLLEVENWGALRTYVHS
jgi:hypothetical protein